MSSPDRPVRFLVEGDAGVLPAEVATPAAVVLNELLQNAIDHAFPDSLDLHEAPGAVTVSLSNDGSHLRADVIDDGVGVPDDFDLGDATGLGLSIVRTLVTSELMGTISLARGDGPPGRPGTIVPGRPGTIVQLDIPVTRPDWAARDR